VSARGAATSAAGALVGSVPDAKEPTEDAPRRVAGRR
jgi:hypothetical protein